jgi:hypothetical protein
MGIFKDNDPSGFEFEIYDEDGKLLGTVMAESESEAKMYALRKWGTGNYSLKTKVIYSGY